MKQTVFLSCFLMVSIVCCFFIQQNLNAKRQEFLKTAYMDYTLPSRFTGLAAMEFKGIVSDFLFLKVSTFFGDKFIKQETLEEKQADYAYNCVDVITDLDPWFWDAYLFSDMLLTWDFKRPEKANELLAKALEYRTDDFKVPYYMGFNYFYFLKDNAKAAQYFMAASKLDGCPSYVTGLATRLSVYQNQFGPAILFLKEILETTRNPVMEKQLTTRLSALLILDDLEKKVKAYKTALGRFPDQLMDLVEKGFIDKIPQDPYGGKFFILKNGRVFTTSKLIFTSKKSS